MRRFHCIATAVSLLLLLTPAPPLSAQAEEDEYAETPTDLAELLKEATDDVLYDFIIDSSGPNDLRVITKHRCERTETCWHFSRREWMIGFNQTSRTDWRYSPEGVLIRYKLTSWSTVTTLTREVIQEGDSQDWIRRYEPNDDREPETFRDTIEVYRPENAIPDTWLTLAIAYHLRQENSSFIIRTHTIPGPGLVAVYAADNTGTEMIDLHGEQVSAHVLVVDIYQELDGERVEGGSLAEVTMYVLDDGSIASDRWQESNANMTREAITVEQADEILSDVALPGNP